jgi:nucleoid-associated protein YgaU
VAPILNLVAPKTIPANPTSIAPPTAANSGTAIVPSVVVPAPGTRGLATITVQVGDSLWTLAQKNLGNGSRWHELVAVNPAISNPNHILAGTTLALPANDTPSVKSNVPATKHVVKKGDTLWAIAQSRLGNALYWSCIAQANPTLKDPNRIYAMQEIFVPASCKE